MVPKIQTLGHTPAGSYAGSLSGVNQGVSLVSLYHLV